MHCSWRRKRRAWGYDVIRGIDEDDPKRVIRAFTHPVELAFVDLNSQVENDYGGYAWTEWMHGHFGDTALHMAIKWKRHRAVKALLSLRPDWAIRNEAGDTAENLARELYGKDMQALKDEQEREYEMDVMRIEDEDIRRMMAADRRAHELAKKDLLDRIHAARTIGVHSEAAILLEHGRVLADEAIKDGRRLPLPLSSVAGRWTAHVCRELRRNRFAAQRGAMRRKVLPARAPVPRSISPSSVRPRTDMEITTSISAASPGGENRCDRTISPGKSTTSRPGLNFNNGAVERRCGGAVVEGESVGGALIDGSIAVHVKPSLSPSVASPLDGGAGSSLHDFCSTRSWGSGSFWSGRTSAASTTRFDRTSRMANARAMKIIAAGKNVRQETPMGRLQRKMANKQRSQRLSRQMTPSPATASAAAAVVARHRAPATRALATATRPNLDVHLTLPADHAPLTASPDATAGALPVKRKNDAIVRDHASAGRAEDASTHGNVGLSGKRSIVDTNDSSGSGDGNDMQMMRNGQTLISGTDPSEGSTLTMVAIFGPSADTGGWNCLPGADTSATARSGAISLSERVRGHASGESKEAMEDLDGGGQMLDVDQQKVCLPETGGLTQSKSIGVSVVADGATADGAVIGTTSREDDHSSAQKQRDVSVVFPTPSTPTSSAPVPGRRPTFAPTTPNLSSSAFDGAPSDMAVVTGPMHDVLMALLTTTAVNSEGVRVLAPSFTCVSSQHELKYCGPVGFPQVTALSRVLSKRYGVLIHLNLAGKRLGDDCAAELAPALAGVRRVDLRRNNIGDDGARAIAEAIATAGRPADVVKKAGATAEDGGCLEGDLQHGVATSSTCVMESLSLAGNRMGDAGCNALREKWLETRKRGSDKRNNHNITTKKINARSSANVDPTRCASLQWLSVAGNPGISYASRRMLQEAGLHCRPLPVTVVI